MYIYEGTYRNSLIICCFVAKSVLLQFTRFYIEKVGTKNCACGEQVTNTRYETKKISGTMEKEEGGGRKSPKWELGFWGISILYTFRASARARNTEIVMDNSGHNGRSGRARQTQRFLYLTISGNI